jgi:hypothetical protein
MEIPIKEWTVMPDADTPTAEWLRFATEADAQAYAAEHGGIPLGIANVVAVD